LFAEIFFEIFVQRVSAAGFGSSARLQLYNIEPYNNEQKEFAFFVNI
jgi:hypothetical protein